MRSPNRLFLYTFTALSFMAITPAYAQNQTNGWDREQDVVIESYKHQDTGHRNDNYTPNVGRPSEIKILDQDRVILSQYIDDFFQTSCRMDHPNRHKPCVPKDYYKREYVMGYPLPSDVTYYDIPYNVRSRLRPTPIGYQYVRVGNDALLINESTTQVMDAVTLLSMYESVDTAD